MTIPFKPADPTIDGIISGLGGPRAAALTKLREIFHTALPNIHESVKNKQPQFDLNGPVCSVRVHQSHLSLMFVRGDDIDDPNGVLKSYGKDKIRFLRVRSDEDLDDDIVTAIVRSAAALNLAPPTQ